MNLPFLWPQARPEEMALKLPGKPMHIRALCGGLRSVRNSLLNVKNLLEDWGEEWEHVQDTVAQDLTTAAMFLGGILDGCLIADLPSDQPVSKNLSFSRTAFTSPDLREIQTEINALRSGETPSQATHASIWSVINFWKHYLPYQPLPIQFTAGRRNPIRDFQLPLSGNGDAKSGPVVHDLLIPAFNAACAITKALLIKYNVPGNHEVRPIPLR